MCQKRIYSSKTLVSQIKVTLFKPGMTNTNQYRTDQTLLIIQGQGGAWLPVRLISSSNFFKRACKEQFSKKSAPKCAGPTSHTTCPLTILGTDHMQKWGLGCKGPRKKRTAQVPTRQEQSMHKPRNIWEQTTSCLPRAGFQEQQSAWAHGLGSAVVALHQLLDNARRNSTLRTSSPSSSVL